MSFSARAYVLVVAACWLTCFPHVCVATSPRMFTLLDVAGGGAASVGGAGSVRCRCCSSICSWRCFSCRWWCRAVGGEISALVQPQLLVQPLLAVHAQQQVLLQQPLLVQFRCRWWCSICWWCNRSLWSSLICWCSLLDWLQLDTVHDGLRFLLCIIIRICASASSGSLESGVVPCHLGRTIECMCDYLLS